MVFYVCEECPKNGIMYKKCIMYRKPLHDFFF
jgi:hypothetical protein